MRYIVQAWLDEFKLALIKEDVDSIERLLETDLTDLSYASQYLAMLNEGVKLVEEKKDALAKDIHKFKKARKYL